MSRKNYITYLINKLMSCHGIIIPLFLYDAEYGRPFTGKIYIYNLLQNYIKLSVINIKYFIIFNTSSSRKILLLFKIRNI